MKGSNVEGKRDGGKLVWETRANLIRPLRFLVLGDVQFGDAGAWWGRHFTRPPRGEICLYMDLQSSTEEECNLAV